MRESHWLEELKRAVDVAIVAIQLRPTWKNMSDIERKQFKREYPNADAAIGGFGIILPKKYKSNPQD